jgi:hypothetical protein
MILYLHYTPIDRALNFLRDLQEEQQQPENSACCCSFNKRLSSSDYSCFSFDFDGAVSSIVFGKVSLQHIKDIVAIRCFVGQIRVITINLQNLISF